MKINSFLVASFWFLVILSTSYQLPATSYAQTPAPDEQILQNLQQGTLPQEVVNSANQQGQQNKDVFLTVRNAVITAAKKYLGFIPNLPSFLVSRSTTQSKSLVPSEVKPTVEPAFLGIDKPIRDIRGASLDLGDKAGVYSIDCPEEIKKSQSTTNTYEYNCYGKGWFPKEYNPFPTP